MYRVLAPVKPGTWAGDKGVAEVVRYAVECLNFDIDLKTASMKIITEENPNFRQLVVKMPIYNSVLIEVVGAFKKKVLICASTLHPPSSIHMSG